MTKSPLVPGMRRAVPVEPDGRLGSELGSHWACERFDGLLWQLVAMASSEDARRRFLDGG